MQPYVIGIDIGTGSTKAIASNTTGEILSSSQSFYSEISGLTNGFAEQDVELIWNAFVSCIKDITSTLQFSPAAISISSCMHSLLLIDKEHKPLTNLITWADTRSEKIAEEIRKSNDAETLYKVTGAPIHSMSLLCKIIWLRKNEPQIFAKAFKFISIKEFIWHRLFNKYQVDYSIASGTGLFNIETLNWNGTSLTMCGIDINQLSEIVSTKYICSDLNSAPASLLGISAGTPFCIGASDGCLANAGSFAIEAGIAAITIGTSGAVRIANNKPVYNYPEMTFNYPLDERTFICGAPVNNAGNVAKWLFKTFLNNERPTAADYKDLFKQIENVSPGCKGLLFLPYLNGERAPMWDEKTCGVYFGLKSYHSKKHLLRAALEGVCYSLNHILQIIEASTGLVTQINVSGGFVSSKAWLQILADITGKKICVIQTEDASAKGAALLGMISHGIITSYDPVKPSNYIITDPIVSHHETYKKYFSIYKNLYPPLKESMHQLFNINS